MPEDETFQFDTEGEIGKLKAVLHFTCPECKRKTKFTARDEIGGKLRCACGLTVDVEGDGLRGAQRSLDEINKSANDLRETFKRLSR